MRAREQSRRLCLLLLASLGACGGKPPEASTLGIETSVDAESSDATASSSSDTSTSDTSTDDSDVSSTGCVDGGNLPPSDGCNPLEQACPEDQGCFWTGDAFSCTPTAAQFPSGEPCGDFDDCRPAMICVDAALLPSCGGAACCAEFCDLDCPDLCSQVGTSCVPFFEMGEAPTGEADIGVCMAP